MLEIITKLILIIALLIFPQSVNAEYVLPYPSYMPGNKLYRVSRVTDQLKKYWYFGNISQIEYHLKLSDKYLIEAKTLFEYKQYLLGSDALMRSNQHFQQIPRYLHQANLEGKDIHRIEAMLREADNEHIRILEMLKRMLPEKFIWIPEKAHSITLELNTLVTEAIELRLK